MKKPPSGGFAVNGGRSRRAHFFIGSGAMPSFFIIPSSFFMPSGFIMLSCFFIMSAHMVSFFIDMSSFFISVFCIAM